MLKINKDLVIQDSKLSLGEIPLKKLWENEDLSVDLANTNITLSSNDYDFLITFYNRNSTTTDLVYSQMSLKGSGIALTATSTASGAYAWIRARELSYVNDTTFEVSDGFFQRVNNTTVTTGLNCSPIAIYGGKF